MEKYIVCKSIFDSRGNPLYMPVGYVLGLGECVDFNRNNVTNGYIALYTSTDDSMGITSYKLPTTTIVDDPIIYGNSGHFFDTIRNTRDTDLVLCGVTIPSHGEYTFFWNYRMSVICHQELESNYRNGLIRFIDKSQLGNPEYELTELESLQRLNAIKTRAWSLRISNEEDRLLWNIFCGQMLLVKFREYIISCGISDPSLGMSIQYKMAMTNTMIQNGMLLEAKYMLAITDTDSIITHDVIVLFCNYIDSCYIPNLTGIV